MNRGVFGERLGKLRKERGFTQSELADRTGVSRTTINNIEKGEQSLTLELFARISEALNFDAPALLRKLQEPEGIVSGATDEEDLRMRRLIEKTIQSSDDIENNND